MKLGEIYYFTTDQAVGYDSRPKYHVYLGDSVWPFDGYIFLFISKSDYGGDYRIYQKDYPFLTYEDSFVSCGSVLDYKAEEFRAANPERKGSLSKLHLAELHASVATSETMRASHIKVVCELLKVAL
jgi:hypothetical protein